MVEQVANHFKRSKASRALSTKKAAEAALFEEGSGLCRLLLFLGASLRLGLLGLLLFLHRLVELLGHELDAVLLHTVLVGPSGFK